MRTLDDTLLFAPSDLSAHAACGHVTFLELRRLAGQIRRPSFADPALEELRARGLDHEQRYLAGLIARRLSVATIAPPVEQLRTREGLSRAAQATLEAMKSATDVVYQGVLWDGGPFWGRPDFLVRTTGRSPVLGDYHYEVVDTKLALSAKVGGVIQVALYGELLRNVQQCAPDTLTLVLGGPEPREERFRHYYVAAYVRRLRARFERDAAGPAPDSYPDPVTHCAVCAWQPHCRKQLRDDDHLSFVAGITRSQRRHLAGGGITTLEALATRTLPSSPSKGPGTSGLPRVQQQARLQLQRRQDGLPHYQILPHPEPERGLARLPPPAPGDIFLDLEGAPYAAGGGIEYLFGMFVPDAAERPYRARWVASRAEEKRAFEETIDFIATHRLAHPDLHVYHFGDYEETAFKRMAGGHSTRADALDQLLRARVFVNLHRVVTQGVRASVESYSIKHLEEVYGFSRDVALADARPARDAVERSLDAGANVAASEEARQTVEGYNRDDCVSAWRLRQWLEERRQEHATTTGAELPRPGPGASAPPEKTQQWNERARPIADRLLEGVPEEPALRSPEQHARWVLAHLLGYHDREQKPVWWEYFHLADMTDAELLTERLPLSGLELIDEAPVPKTVSAKAKGNAKPKPPTHVLSRYRFPPQEHAIAVDHTPVDPRRGPIGENAGTVEALDDATCEIILRRRGDAPHPAVLIPREQISVAVLKEALLRLASAVADSGFARGGAWTAASDLLLRRPPRVGQPTGAPLVAGLVTTRAAVALTEQLAPTTLAIQGPPGAGKTFTGARMILALLARGKRVGITGPNHKAIRNFLDEVCKAATASPVAVRALQKIPPGSDAIAAHNIQLASDNADIDEALAGRTVNLIAGTAWLWARSEMTASVDVIFADEAGQMSLANTLACAGATESLVLLGDPQQLDQVQKATHPEGTEVSALQHLLGDQQTIPPDRGLFLAETWRLHPTICKFTSELFYDARLRSREGLERQMVVAAGVLQGSGLRFVPVDHEGNKNASAEEVVTVGSLVAGLLEPRAEWVDGNGARKPLRPEDILVVSPYNAQVAALAHVLPAGTCVGTVDKFQGREAPVVIYSMATSSAEDAPRGMEFLYSLNRLNVATSRARCLAVVVASPALLAPSCGTPRQIVLANALCRFVDLAA